jgi:hypothetical protein
MSEEEVILIICIVIFTWSFIFIYDKVKGGKR